jgi:hypothetical protein
MCSSNEKTNIMQNDVKTPVHLWIVAIVSLLWNAMGAFDYLATKLRLEFYMSQFTPEQLDYFYAFPSWMVVAWAIGVWGSLFGSVALLLRKSLAVWLFGASILGLTISTLYNFVLTDGAEAMGSGAVIFTAVIWVIVLLLFFYARAMAKRGVLN